MDITDTNTSICFFWGSGLRSQTRIVPDASNIDIILYTYQKSDFEYSDLEMVRILNVQIHIQISLLVFEPFSNRHLEISILFPISFNTFEPHLQAAKIFHATICILSYVN